MSRMPHQFTPEELLDLMDTATDALEELAPTNKVALAALTRIGKRTEALMAVPPTDYEPGLGKTAEGKITIVAIQTAEQIIKHIQTKVDGMKAKFKEVTGHDYDSI